MEFLRKPDAEVWLQLEDAEIDKILEDMDKIPSFNNIISAINEFRNALSLLKRRRSQGLADNVHQRAISLYKTFDRLRADFLAIKQETGKAEDIEKYMADNFLVVDAMVGGMRDQFYASKDRGFVIGRANIDGLSNHFSRALLQIIPLEGRNLGSFLVRFVGTSPCKVEPPNEIVYFEGSGSDKQLIIRMNVPIRVINDSNEQFFFILKPKKTEKFL